MEVINIRNPCEKKTPYYKNGHTVWTGLLFFVSVRQFNVTFANNLAM